MSNNTFHATARALVTAAAFAAAAAFPFAANAAGTEPVTHAGLMKELSELRSVGYDLQDDSFPESLQRAERKLEQKRQAEKQAVSVQSSPSAS